MYNSNVFHHLTSTQRIDFLKFYKALNYTNVRYAIKSSTIHGDKILSFNEFINIITTTLFVY